MKAKDCNFSVSPSFIDMIGFTLPIAEYSHSKLFKRLDDLFGDKHHKVKPINKKAKRPYKHGLSLAVAGCSDVKICWEPRLKANPLRIEFNPAGMTLDDMAKLAKTLRKILGKSVYAEIWSKARCTRLDATTDIIDCAPDNILVIAKRCKEQTIKLDGSGRQKNRKYGSPKSGLSLSTYNKSKAKQLITRAELRIKPGKLMRHNLPLGLINITRIITSNPFYNIKIFRADFADDIRFDPGFYDCAKNRGLTPAINHYASRNKVLADSYMGILLDEYQLAPYDPRDVWKGILKRMDVFSVFR
jgi:hypothetical protein